MAIIPVAPGLAIDERDITETFVRASGPGGQNVNKLSTAVELRFDANSPSLPERVRVRLQQLAGRRLNKDGVLVITSQRHRTQARNRQDARERLLQLLRRAAVAPISRRPTRPPPSAAQRRLQAKKQRSLFKAWRRAPSAHD